MRPALARNAFSAWAIAWTTGGWFSPGENEAAPAAPREIRGNGAREGVRREAAAGVTGARRGPETDSGRDGPGELLDVPVAEGPPVVGARPRRGHRGLDDVETARAAARSGLAAPRREGARVGETGGTGREEVGVEREDHVGLRDLRDRVHGGTESEARALADVVASRRLPLVPPRGRERRPDLARSVARASGK